MKYPLKFGRQENLTTYLWLCYAGYKQNTLEKWTKCCLLPFPKKGDFGITKNYRGITLTTTAAWVYNALLFNHIWLEIEKILRKKSDWLLKKLLHNFTDSDNPSNHQRCMSKESQGNTTVYRFLQGIWFHTQRKEGANTTSIWSPQRNGYHYNDALQKHENNGLLTWWRLQLLWHFHWCFSRRYISTIYVYNLPRLCTLNTNKSNKRKWFHIKKGKKQTISHWNYDWCRQCRWSNTSHK